MGKTKTSIREKTYTKSTRRKTPSRTIKPGMKVSQYNPTEALLNEERLGRAIWECLKNGDSEGVIEVIQIHLEACNKTKLAQKVNLPKTTLYSGLRSKNPTIKTLAKLVHACV